MRLVRVFILFLCLPAIAAAQGTTSRMLGQVVDSTGAVLPGVTVTLRHLFFRAACDFVLNIDCHFGEFP